MSNCICKTSPHGNAQPDVNCSQHGLLHPTRDTLVERKVEEVHVLAVELKRATDSTNDAIGLLNQEITEAVHAISALRDSVTIKERRIGDLRATLATQRKAYAEQASILADTILGCAQR